MLRFVGGAEFLVDGGHIENVVSPEFKWEMATTLRFIAKKIARRSAASAIWRATTDDDEHYVYAIAL